MNKFNNCNKALLTIFHACIENDESEKISTKRLLSQGVVFLNQNNNIADEISVDTYELSENLFGLCNEMWSNTFHKSLEKVADFSVEDLVKEQLLHYFSTYGFLSLGYQPYPYIPIEKLNLDFDSFAGKGGFTLIKIIDQSTAIEYINQYFQKVKAPNALYMNEINELIPFTTLNINEVASYEIKALYYDYLNQVPQEGVEFLRFIIYKATGLTLLLKNRQMINYIKWRSKYYPDLYKYFTKIDLQKLAEIFYRFKLLFLAFKGYDCCAPYINKIRRLAKKYHKPLNDVNVQNVSNLLHQGRSQEVQNLLQKVSNRQLIKLYNYFAAEAWASNKHEGFYTIRNGASYYRDDKKVTTKSISATYQGLELTQEVLIQRFKDTLAGKIFYIPSYISYAVPVSEKQFIGIFPYGTRISYPEDQAFTTAIAWENYQGRMTDLDLHLNGKYRSYGWNSYYKEEDNSVLFSGDMTDATNGAVEAFYFEPIENDTYILSVQQFLGAPNVPFQFLMTKKKFLPIERGVNSTPPVDVADAIFPPINLQFNNNSSMTIGIFNSEYARFILYGNSLDANSIIPNKALYAKSLDVLTNKIWHMVQLKDLLTIAGATVITDEEEKKNSEHPEEIIDLSPACLTTTTLFDIIDQVNTST